MVGRRTGGSAVASALAVGCLLLAPAARADETGGVQIAAELASEERTEETVRLEFAVHLEGDVECATVTYDLVLEELLPNAQWKAVRETRQAELRDRSGSDRVEHVMSADIRLLGYSARVVDSAPCSG